MVLIGVSCLAITKGKCSNCCLIRCIRFFNCVYFCRQVRYQTDGSDGYDYILVPPVSDSEPASSKTLQDKLFMENKLLLLSASFTAPLVCVATHASYVIMAWSSDLNQASSMTVVVILSFFYYFIAFRQLYIILAFGCCIQAPVCRCQEITSQSADHTLTSEESEESDTEILKEYHDVTVGHCSCLFCCKLCCYSLRYIVLPLNVEEPNLELKTHQAHLSKFRFRVLLIEILTAPFVMGIEAVVVLMYYFLPAPVETVPANVLNIFHLALIIGSALVAYRLLKVHMPTDQIILKNFLETYGAQKGNLNVSSDNLPESVGEIS